MPKGFQKGNRLGQGRPKGSRNLKNLEWEGMGQRITGEMSDNYIENVGKMFQGVKLTDEELEAMNRYEKVLEYFKPKHSRIEKQGEIDHTVTFKWDE